MKIEFETLTNPTWVVIAKTKNGTERVKQNFSSGTSNYLSELRLIGFSEQNAAERYAKALIHAIKLCQKKEPF